MELCPRPKKMTSPATSARSGLLAWGASDVGRVRENNEDRFHIDPDGEFFIVADGVGGNNAGEKAAEIACETIAKRLKRRTGSVTERIREAITLANNEIFRSARENQDLDGMACVLTVAVLENGRVTVGHVGDTRLYLLTDEKITKITKDHSPVGVLEDNFKISEIEAMSHPNRNEVFRDVGSQSHSPNDANFIDIYEYDSPSDSHTLLCSDGLTDRLTSSEIYSFYLRQRDDPANLTKTLIAAANDVGGDDNITVVISPTASEKLVPPKFTRTADVVLNEDSQSEIRIDDSPPRQILNTLNQILFSRAFFFLYGALVTIVGFIVWRFFVAS